MFYYLKGPVLYHAVVYFTWNFIFLPALQQIDIYQIL